MVERRGPRPIDQIEEEWPTEAPITPPADQTDDTTPSDVGEDIGEPSEPEATPLPRMEPLGPGDREAAFWNNEADAIEAWAAEVGDPEAYTQDVLRRMYEPTPVTEADDVTPPDVGEDIGGEVGQDVGDVDIGSEVNAAEAGDLDNTD